MGYLAVLEEPVPERREKRRSSVEADHKPREIIEPR
jgi:hypothetical protein